MASTKRTTSGLDKVIGQRVRTARLELKLSQNDLGVALGVSFQQVQKYEKGVNRVSSSTLHEIARILQKPISYFMDAGAIKMNPRGVQMATFMATRQGQQLVGHAMLLTPDLQQMLIDVAAKLANHVPVARRRKEAA